MAEPTELLIPDLQDRGRGFGLDPDFVEKLVRHYDYRIAKKLVELKNIRHVLGGTGDRPKIDVAKFREALRGLSLTMGDRALATGEGADYKAANLLAGILKDPEKVDLFFEILCK